MKKKISEVRKLRGEVEDLTNLAQRDYVERSNLVGQLKVQEAINAALAPRIQELVEKLSVVQGQLGASIERCQRFKEERDHYRWCLLEHASVSEFTPPKKSHIIGSE